MDSIAPDPPESVDTPQGAGQRAVEQMDLDEALDQVGGLVCKEWDKYTDDPRHRDFAPTAESLEALVCVLGHEPAKVAEYRYWLAVERTRAVAALMSDMRRSNIAWTAAPLSNGFYDAMAKLTETLDKQSYRNPPPAFKEHVVHLESPQTLLAEKVPHESIAGIYGLRDANGQPDLQAVQEVLDGRRDWPRTKVFRKAGNKHWPKYCPSLGEILEVKQWVEEGGGVDVQELVDAE